MTDIYATTIVNLVAALIAGGIIGIERSYNGRPAGFRTHTLVCMASSLLMLVTVYQVQLLPGLPPELLRIDPTRMGQGIMTGIGFLGAGVIVKERMTVRGLTTAGSIWITASIGILIGVGFYFAATLATLLTVGTLSLFRLIEARLPALYYGRVQVRMPSQSALSENEISDIIRDHNFSPSDPSYHLTDDGKLYEYQMTVRTRDTDNFSKLAAALAADRNIREFDLMRVGE
ncbi:MAG: MgtC/SapB family protein [Acidiferrobacterales bacterium]